jgi:hypothetical protein
MAEEVWLPGFSHKVDLTIDSSKVSGTLTNFPVYVHISAECGIGDSDLSSFFSVLATESNQKKVAFTGSDGLTQFYAEIDHFNLGTKEAGFHVKVPSISSSEDTELWLYWGRKAEPNNAYTGLVTEAPAQAVWDGTNALVYHLSQDPTMGTTPILDSTSNERHAITTGTMDEDDLVDVPPHGKGLDFNGSQSIYYDEEDAFSSLDSQIECLFYPTTISVNRYLIRQWANHTSISNGNYIRQDSSNRIHFFSKPAYVNTNAYISGVVQNTWQYAAGTRGGTTSRATLNTAYGTASKSGICYASDRITVAPNFVGRIAEVRVHTNDRAESWRDATYYNLMDNFITMGSIQSRSDVNYGLALYGGEWLPLAGVKIMKNGEWQPIKENKAIIKGSVKEIKWV